MVTTEQLEAALQAWRDAVGTGTVARMLAALEAAEKAAWRPISEHKPVDGVSVLIAARGAMETVFVVSAYYDENEGRWLESNTHATDHFDGSVNHPIAVRPLPTPPEAP